MSSTSLVIILAVVVAVIIPIVWFLGLMFFPKEDQD